MREFFNVSLVASHDHSELMRTTTFSHATHSRLHVCTLGHHYDEYAGTERRLAPFILHYIYIYIHIHEYMYALSYIKTCACVC
jgi:hypothetical protein